MQATALLTSRGRPRRKRDAVVSTCMQGPYLGRRVWIQYEGKRQLISLLVDGRGGGGEPREAATDLDVLERDQQDPRLATVGLHAVKLRMAAVEHLAQHLMRGRIDGDFVSVDDEFGAAVRRRALETEHRVHVVCVRHVLVRRRTFDGQQSQKRCGGHLHASKAGHQWQSTHLRWARRAAGHARSCVGTTGRWVCPRTRRWP